MTPVVGSLLIDPQGHEWRVTCVDYGDGNPMVAEDIDVHLVNVAAGGTIVHTLAYLRRFWRAAQP